METFNQTTDMSLTSYCEVLKSLGFPVEVEDGVIMFYASFEEKLQLRFALSTTDQYLCISLFSEHFVVPEDMQATMAEFIVRVNCEHTITYLGSWNLDYESGGLFYTYNLMRPTTRVEFRALLRNHIIPTTSEILSTYMRAILAILHEEKTLKEALAMLQEENFDEEEDEESEEDFTEEGDDESDTFLI